MILSIDPGTTESAYVLVDELNRLKPLQFDKIPNEQMILEITKIVNSDPTVKISVEMIASYGQSVGNEIFTTCRWIGRFEEKCLSHGITPTLILRRNVKSCLIKGKMRGNDSEIRKALIAKFAQFDFKNGKGTSKKRDVFYGFHSDIWQAMAVAVTHESML